MREGGTERGRAREEGPGGRKRELSREWQKGGEGEGGKGGN